MKLIDEKEVTAIAEVVEELERRLEYWGDDMDPEAAGWHRTVLSGLKGVLERPDHTPEVRYVEVEVPVEKVLDGDEIEDRLKMAERHGRESVDPNFRLCVWSTHRTGELWVTDDMEAAMGKAAWLSKAYGTFYTVYEIRKDDDGTYKTWSDTTWCDGEILHERHEMFLHFDYMASVAGKVTKI